MVTLDAVAVRRRCRAMTVAGATLVLVVGVLFGGSARAEVHPWSEWVTIPDHISNGVDMSFHKNGINTFYFRWRNRYKVQVRIDYACEVIDLAIGTVRPMEGSAYVDPLTVKEDGGDWHCVAGAHDPDYDPANGGVDRWTRARLEIRNLHLRRIFLKLPAPGGGPESAMLREMWPKNELAEATGQAPGAEVIGGGQPNGQTPVGGAAAPTKYQWSQPVAIPDGKLNGIKFQMRKGDIPNVYFRWTNGYNVRIALHYSFELVDLSTGVSKPGDDWVYLDPGQVKEDLGDWHCVPGNWGSQAGVDRWTKTNAQVRNLRVIQLKLASPTDPKGALQDAATQPPPAQQPPQAAADRTAQVNDALQQVTEAMGQFNPADPAGGAQQLNALVQRLVDIMAQDQNADPNLRELVRLLKLIIAPADPTQLPAVLQQLLDLIQKMTAE
jgi:hypothetical protein